MATDHREPHSIGRFYLDAVGPLTASALVGARGSIQLTISPRLAEDASSTGEEIGSPGLIAAARALIRSDALLEADIIDGREVSVEVSPGTAPFAAVVPDTAPGDIYRRSRPPLSRFLWPSLSEPPVLDSLYQYQQEGVAWLRRRHAAILADDMGLGKTVTTLVSLAHLIAEGHLGTALVLAPKSLLATWRQEAKKWVPDLATIQLAPTATYREEAWRSVLGRFHIAFTNYEGVRELPGAVAEHEFPVLVLDEAHRTRRLDAQITSSVRKIRALHVWALTGTPIERDQADLTTLLSTIEPARFSTSDLEVPPSTLRSRAKPYVLRRTKEDVLADLPDVIERVEWLEMAIEQRRAYDEVLVEAKRSRRAGEPTIQYFSRLLAICDGVPHVTPSPKVERVVELSQGLRACGEKGVVFSYKLSPLDYLGDSLAESEIRHVRLDGSLSSQERELVLTRFKSDPGITLLLASSRVASEGLTLTEANNVIFLNEWWNPSNNSQARDRVRRIGQTRTVVVSRLRMEGTIEERLAHLLETKEDVFDDVIGALEGRSSIAFDTSNFLFGQPSSAIHS